MKSSMRSSMGTPLWLVSFWLVSWLGSACTSTPATVTAAEPVAELKEPELEAKPKPIEIPVLGRELGLPPPPDFVAVEVPALYEDETWSILGLRSVLDEMLPEAELDRVVLVSAYVQEVYEPPPCPEDKLCPPGKKPHAWLVDAPEVRGKQMALMLVDIEFPIPEWDEATLRYWADEPELTLVPGLRYVFMGRLRRFSDSGFAHDRGLLEMIAVTDYPRSPNSRWIFPRNSENHPKARRDRGGAPLNPQLATVPAEIVAGAPMQGAGPLVEPRDRDHAYELGIAAGWAGQPRRADYYLRWLIVDDPSLPRGWRELGRMYVDNGEFEAGLAIIDLAIERSPEDYVLYVGRGVLLLNSNDFSGAIESYQRAIELEPEATDALFGLGIAYAELGERELAVEWMTKFLEIGTDAPEHVKKAAQDTIMRMQYPI